ncbi:GNAT family N-acetyltransferase [Flavobacterium phragmitis]|uniref:Putative acetyltransferase n=1 Tax=Flavobacterium phragmitis TaxID=739143 RepID=A0A1I1U887_9FLAO|nr:GNAT family N-acetyltransferase [Flavobacterium phragmitis]SFD66865.1 putative acetyltransferase [Flavobacterium phragmitis]
MNFEILKYKTEYKESILRVWQQSVLSTHHFLAKEDFLQIKAMLQEFDFTKLDVFCLMMDKIITGFIGIQNQKIEMLFLDPQIIGKGYGEQLVNFIRSNYQVNLVDVNEQNNNAKLFYEKMGFEVYDRNELDDMGKNYPILKMKLKEV